LWLAASRNCIIQVNNRSIPPVTLDSSSSTLSSSIYQCDLFQTLANRSRLLELINVFDSEQQPPGSIIRSRQSLPSKNSAKSGFGANTSLHLESTPDICALLSTYLSALPEPILLPALFRPIWDWCGLDRDEMDTLEFKCSSLSDVVCLPSPFWNTNKRNGINTYLNYTLITQLVLHLGQKTSPAITLLLFTCLHPRVLQSSCYDPGGERGRNGRFSA
jgi:hypothetical protein